jgi:hypothetical protein
MVITLSVVKIMSVRDVVHCIYIYKMCVCVFVHKQVCVCVCVSVCLWSVIMYISDCTVNFMLYLK